MTRAHRHYIPGCAWHMTHRCHKKEFSLKFSRDRHRWVQWLKLTWCDPKTELEKFQKVKFSTWMVFRVT